MFSVEEAKIATKIDSHCLNHIQVLNVELVLDTASVFIHLNIVE